MPKSLPVTLKTHHAALKLLSRKNNAQIRIVLDNTPSLRKALKLLFRTILKGGIKMGKSDLKKLKRHRTFIRKHAHMPIKTDQKGGSIIRTILQTILPLLPAIL